MPVKSSRDDRPEQPEFNPVSLVADMALDLKLVLAFVAIAFVFIYVPYLNYSPVRPAIGILMVLFIPGYALIAALFPGRSDLGRMERAALSLGLSIAISSLIGLGLNYTPWGIRLDPLVVCISAFTVVFVLVANMRRHALPGGEGFALSLKSLTATIRGDLFNDSQSRFDRALSFALIAGVLLSIGLTIVVLSVPKQGEVFTEFYILGPSDRSDNYPVSYVLGETKPVIIGIVNHEFRNVTYDLGVVLEYGNGIATLYNKSVTLGNEQRWEQMVNLTPNHTGTLMRMDFQLYADGQISKSSDLHLWVNVTQPPQ